MKDPRRPARCGAAADWDPRFPVAEIQEFSSLRGARVVTLLRKSEGVPAMGTKPLKALRGYRASNRGSEKL